MNAIITKIGREKLLKARKGLISLPAITGIVLGDAGVDASGNVKNLDEDTLLLEHEIFRKPYDNFTDVGNYTYRYAVTLGKTELVGKKISEIGLYDSDGDIICIRHFSDKQKDEGMEMIFEVDDKF